MSHHCDSLLRHTSVKLLVLACSALALGQVAQAQERLEEVVVTATKRADPISKVPISMSALTQDAMDAQGVRNIQDIVAQTPGVDIDQLPGGGMTISIRGISSVAGAATTGVYIDDTPIQARNNATNFSGTSYPEVFDLERVEVLRGPQGTLFGAGAEGGVVRFLTVQPSLTQYSGYSRAEVSATDHGTPSAEFGVAYGGPIVENVLGFRVSGWDRHDGGYVNRRSWESASAQSKSDWGNTKVLRAALIYAPTSNIKITPAIQFQEQYTHNPSSYWGQLSNPGKTEFISGAELNQPTDDSSTVASVKVEADLGAILLTSVSSYFHRNNNLRSDVTNTDTAAVLGVDYVFPVAPDGSLYTVTSLSHTKQQILTQELRLQNSDAAAKLKWLGGVFFSQAKEQDTLAQPAPGFPAVFEQARGIPFTDYFGAPLLDGIYEFTGDERSNDQQIALFGNADWRFAARWTLTAGLRVSETKIDYSVAQGGPQGPIPGSIASNSGVQKDHPVTPKVGLSWEPDDHNMVYTSVAKGYRIGGVNGYIPTYCGEFASIAQPTYQSDTTTSYELGAKSRPAGGRVQIDASVFHVNWKDIQQSVGLPCFYTFTGNSGSATSNGFDLSVNMQVASGLVVGASLGYTNAKYTTTTTAPGSSVIVTANGQTLGGDRGITPWSVFGYAEYSFHIPGGVEAYARIQEKYNSQDRGPFGSQNPNNISYDPYLPLDQSVNLLDFRMGLLLGKLDVSLFVDNVLNRSPLLHTTHQVFTNPITGGLDSSPLYTSSTVRPRTAGLTAVFRF